MNPKIARAVLVAAGIAALVFALVLQPLPPPPPPIVEVPYVIATDAADLIKPLIEEFNRLNKEAAGRRVHVSPTVAASGNAVGQILGGGLEPVAWTPGTSLWAGLLNAKCLRTPRPTACRNGDRVRAGTGPSLVQSPQVVAMFKTTADELGLSSSEPLERVLDLAAATDVPLSRRLKLGHTDPNVSTSGLSAVLSEFYLAAGKPGDGLTSGNVLDLLVREKVRRWEASIVQYLDIAKDFKDLWCRYGPPFAAAAYMQETTFLEFNATCQEQLVAIYPTDVPLVTDYPYLVLEAPWVSLHERMAADVFGRWLDEHLSKRCDAIDHNGFRKKGCIPSNVDASQPKVAPPPRPDPEALSDAQRAWGELRRPANIMLVVDQTNRMANSGKLASAKEALALGQDAQPPFVECPRDQDHVGMIAFGGDVETPVRQLVPLGPYSDAQHKERLETAIQGLAAATGPAVLFDAIDKALNTPGMLDPATINTIIVLSVGVNQGSRDSQPGLVEKVSRLVSKGLVFQILLVPYGDPAALRGLTDLVQESLGRTYNDPATKAPADDATGADTANVSKFVCQFL